MITINPYLNFAGNAEEAFEFYKSVFGGEFEMIQRYKETPEGDKVPEGDKDKIMHVSLPIGKNMLMATDAIESAGQKLEEGNNFYLSLNVDSQEEADRLYDALVKGGNSELVMSQSFWGSYFGMLTDRFGVRWMISYDPKRQDRS